jgi:glyoxylase-like metal-dependent hydrolase (beta-lactamase superfamily II)
MTEVVPGIHQIKLPLPGMASLLGYVNAYLVRGEKGHLMADTGLNTAGAYGALQKQMTEAGAAIKDIAQIVITHIHPDHYGLAGGIKQLSAAKLALEDAQLNIREDNTFDTGVVTATTLSVILNISEFTKEAADEGPQFVNPAMFPGTTINAPIISTMEPLPGMPKAKVGR